MTPQMLAQLLPLIISAINPHVIALLNDPRPNRAWLRVLTALVVILLGAAFQTLTLGPWSWLAFVQVLGPIFLGSTGVFVLLNNLYLGKLQDKGFGLGVLFDIAKRLHDESGNVAGVGENALADFQTEKQRLAGFLASSAITQPQYDALLIRAQKEILGLNIGTQPRTDTQQ
jgi:hypothetical protein